MQAIMQRALDQANACVVCGLCLPHCPTYQATGLEAQSPRGRIQLMRGMLMGDLQASPRIAQHLSDCLTCRACERACPNQVEYGSLVDTMRQSLNAQALIPKTARAPRLLHWMVAKPWRITLGNKALKLAQTTGLLRLSFAKGLLQRQRLWDDACGLPTLAWSNPLKPYYPSTAQTQQGEVALFTGCLARSVDWQSLQDSITVLNALGFGVHIPTQQGCCGAMAAHAGENTQAFTQRNQSAFAAYTHIPLLFTATGCGTQLIEAQQHPNTQEICAFLAQQALHTLKLRPLAQQVLVQIPCSHYNVLKNHRAIEACLSTIPELTLQTLKHTDCCGAAGAYHLQAGQHAQAKQLQANKINAIEAYHADYLVSTNVGCALWLRGGLKQRNAKLQVLHPVSLLAQQLVKS